MDQGSNQKADGLIRRAVANLFPGYFALVMATGITSIATHSLGMTGIASAFVYINVPAFVILWAMLILRLVWFFSRVRSDLGDHVRGPGFFTVVAASCVLGSQFVIVRGEYEIAAALWFLGIICWLVIMYGFFTAVTIREDKPVLQKGISGSWLVTAVATQSISVLGTLLAAYFSNFTEQILFLSLCMFLIGCMLYLMLITLIFYRFTFLDITRETLTPPYWINMGAVAITTLAGARLILAAGEWPLLNEIRPFLVGFTLFFWASGTWWIPLLFILGFWRHIYKRLPLSYDPQYWSMVFPLGMYTACTFQLAKALPFEPLLVIPKIFVFLALTAWIAAFLGMIYSFVPRRN